MQPKNKILQFIPILLLLLFLLRSIAMLITILIITYSRARRLGQKGCSAINPLSRPSAGHHGESRRSQKRLLRPKGSM